MVVIFNNCLANKVLVSQACPLSFFLFLFLPTWMLSFCRLLVKVVIIIIFVHTRNELASLAHSFYTCLKHQLIHLTIVLLRSTCIYLGFIVVWSFIPRDTYTVRCGAARPAQLHHQRERACAHP